MDKAFYPGQQIKACAMDKNTSISQRKVNTVMNFQRTLLETVAVKLEKDNLLRITVIKLTCCAE